MKFLSNLLNCKVSNVSATAVLVAYIPILSSWPSYKHTVGYFALCWQAPESSPGSTFLPNICNGKERPMSGNIVLVLTGNHLCGRISPHSQINMSWLEPMAPWQMCLNLFPSCYIENIQPIRDPRISCHLKRNVLNGSLSE